MGHKLEYAPSKHLGTVINVTLQDKKLAEGVQVHYLKMSYVGSDNTEEVDGPLTRGSVTESYGEMKLNIAVQNCPVVKENVEMTEEDDPYQKIEEHLTKVIGKRMMELSKDRKGEIDGVFPTGVDVQYDGNDRRVVARVLMCANQIAIKGRRGPATFVMTSMKHVLKLITPMIPNKGIHVLSQLESFGKVAGLDIIINEDMGDTVLVGRKGLPDEGCLGIVTSKEDISGELTDKGLDIRYSLTEFPNSKDFYMQFDII